MFDKKNGRVYARTFWPEGCSKLSRDMDGIRKYYDEYTSGEYGEIDEQSFNDLNLESLFLKMDGTYTSAGESKLYDMLRKPVRSQKELDDRREFMQYFSKNEDDRVEVQAVLYELGPDKKFNFMELLVEEYEGNNFKKIAYLILGKIIPLIIILLGAFYKTEIFYLLFAVLLINSIVASKERGFTSKSPFQGIYYATALVRCGNGLSKLDIDVLKPYQDRIQNAINNIGSDVRKLNTVSGSVMGSILTFPLLEPFSDIIGAVILNVENAYYSVIDNINKHKEPLRELYATIGEVDALISAQGYIERAEYTVTKPIFVKEGGFEIVDGAHPLVSGVVKNSITMDNKGIVLTGTNMSGKSTFIRMLGINTVLAQSFNFVHAKKYKAEFLNFVSSISPQDDVENGKSYYIAEAEAVLRIIHALDGEYKVFCGIDEIFRGTNPVERIAASEEILKYIQKRNSLSIVATHDKELTDLLTQSHDFYHFSEKVSDKEGLSFDYKLKSGVLKTRNAIKLLKYIGYPDEIIKGAYASIENSEKKH